MNGYIITAGDSIRLSQATLDKLLQYGLIEPCDENYLPYGVPRGGGWRDADAIRVYIVEHIIRHHMEKLT